MLKWIVDENNNVETLIDYLQANQIEFKNQSIWNPSLNNGLGSNQLPDTTGSILAINYHKFFDLIKHNQDELLSFVKGNFVWVWSDMDGSYPLKDYSYVEPMKIFDQLVDSGKVYYFIDGMPTPENWMWQLKNIRLKIYPYNFIVGRAPIRIIGGITEKSKDSKDFLLTTVLKPIAPHRQLLKDKMQSRLSLFQNSTVKFHNSTRDIFSGHFLGEYNSHIALATEVPSMDLHRSHYLEIAPETFYNNCQCITEKTLKSIIAKTPFITVAPPGQLEYLRSLGFQTFDGIINESYDREIELDHRIDMILDSLEQVKSIGSQKIYNDCRGVLEHNHRNLMMLVGGWKYNIELFITKTLAEISG